MPLWHYCTHVICCCRPTVMPLWHYCTHVICCIHHFASACDLTRVMLHYHLISPTSCCISKWFHPCHVELVNDFAGQIRPWKGRSSHLIRFVNRMFLTPYIYIYSPWTGRSSPLIRPVPGRFSHLIRPVDRTFLFTNLENHCKLWKEKKIRKWRNNNKENQNNDWGND